MVITQPRTWYVCDECGEWFYYPENYKIPKKCPDCKKGKLVKTCAFCGIKFEECKCIKEELAKKCHKCGFLKEKCICKK